MTLPAPAEPAAGPGRSGRAKRPAFGLLVGATVLLRGGREVLERVAISRWGPPGALLVGAAGLAIVLGWRAAHKRKVARQGGQEHTPASVLQQIADSGIDPPAFVEDGTLLGASVLVVNQRTKLLEVVTEYEVFGSAGQPLGAVRQVGQSGAKKVARVLTAFDQFFTHRFDVLDAWGRPVLRLVRPAKLFRSRLHVLDGVTGAHVGTIRQVNVVWKKRFALEDVHGRRLGAIEARNLRAWDFDVVDATRRPVATVVKSWEGWARTALSRADRYTVRVHEPLPAPLRQLTFAAALAMDLALKQDARSFG